MKKDTIAFQSTISDFYNPEIIDPLTRDKGVIINGVKWTTRNVAASGIFAANPEDAGMYQWNRKIGWFATDPMVNSNKETEWDLSRRRHMCKIQ